jgi:hypothetical protein
MKPTPIDTRFLSVHPSTLTWWQRRETCRACKHHSADDARLYENKAERCHAYKPPRVHRGPLPYELCVDARAAAAEREDGKAGLCGPAAKMFEQKEGGAA